jgi:hypothetical protein
VGESHNLPILIGDLNCVQGVLDTMVNFKAKVCRPLADFLATFPVVDSFRHCHPNAKENIFRRPGVAPSCLDRAYLPGHYFSSLLSVRNVATTSDHAALCLSFGGVLARHLAPPPQPEANWKFNSAGARLWSCFSGTMAGGFGGQASGDVLSRLVGWSGQTLLLCFLPEFLQDGGPQTERDSQFLPGGSGLCPQG